MKAKVSGQGYIEHGNIKREFKNHFVTGGLELMAWLFNFNGGQFNGLYNYNEYWYVSSAEVGADTSTKTTFLMSTLVSPLSTLINPSITQQANYFNGSTASAQITILYPTSALPSATIGEIGINGTYYAYNNFNGYAAKDSLNLMSRASTADGDFAAFAYNPANLLQITWTMIFSWV